jgi:hypothetical protein
VRDPEHLRADQDPEDELEDDRPEQQLAAPASAAAVPAIAPVMTTIRNEPTSMPMWRGSMAESSSTIRVVLRRL